MSKVILTDVDDALLDWTSDFQQWILDNTEHRPTTSLRDFWNIEVWLGITIEESRDLIRRFNGHEDYWPNFKALPGAKEAIENLHGMGYKFVAITACATDSWTYENRFANLRREFGAAFDTLHCVGLSQPKTEYLERYRPTFWVEDKWKHAVDGADHGHTSFIVDYEHNRHHEDDRIIRVSGWSEIYDHIVKSQN